MRSVLRPFAAAHCAGGQGIARSGVLSDMPVRIAPVHRVVLRIGVPVRPHALLDGIPIIRRDEAAEDRVHVAGVQVDQAGLGVVALADIAFLGGEGGVGAFAISGVARVLGDGARGVRDHADGGQVVAVEGEERSAAGRRKANDLAFRATNARSASEGLAVAPTTFTSMCG